MARMTVNEEEGHFRDKSVISIKLLMMSMTKKDLAMSDQEPVIVFALFSGATQLDFTGPHGGVLRHSPAPR